MLKVAVGRNTITFVAVLLAACISLDLYYTYSLGKSIYSQRRETNIEQCLKNHNMFELYRGAANVGHVQSYQS